MDHRHLKVKIPSISHHFHNWKRILLSLLCFMYLLKSRVTLTLAVALSPFSPSWSWSWSWSLSSPSPLWSLPRVSSLTPRSQSTRMTSHPASETPPSSNKLRLIWHRRDLRLHDNILYHPKHSNFNYDCDNDGDDVSTRIASVFIIDPEDFVPRKSTTCHPAGAWDTVVIGPHSCRIMIESLHDLRRSLRNRGSDLWIRQGPTIDELVKLIDEIQPTEICWHEEPGVYEQRRSSSVYKMLSEKYPSLKIYTDMQYTLYHPDDLPTGHDEWDILARPNRTRSSKRNRGGQQGKRND